jgi:hypothetical protein
MLNVIYAECLLKHFTNVNDPIVVSVLFLATKALALQVEAEHFILLFTRQV